MAMFISSSETCAVRQDGSTYVFHDPSDPQNMATGSWADVVNIATKILVYDVRKNGGNIGLIFNFAEEYALGILDGTISAKDEDSAQNLLDLIAQIKAL